MSMSKESFEQLLEQVLKNRIQSLEILGNSTDRKRSSEQAIQLAKAILENSSLEKITINFCDDFSTAAWKAIGEALRNHPHIEFLDLSKNNQVNPKIAKIILDIAVSVIANSKTLRYLNLSANVLGDLCLDDITALANVLMNSQSLRELDLHFNFLEPEAAQILSRVIACSRLQHLDISENRLLEAGGKCIAQGVRASRYLQTLVINFNCLGPVGVKAIADAAASLRRLYINVISITDEIVGGIPRDDYMANGRALATLIMHGESLDVLSLNGCNLGLEGISAIFRALRHSRSLTQLAIAGNIDSCEKINHEVMKEMIEGVSGCSSLLELDISINRLDASHRIGIVEIIRCGNLQRLNLSNNNLGLKVAQAIAQVLPESSIQSLNMSSTGLGPEGGKAIAEGLRNNQCLLDLDLSYNRLFVEGFKAVLDALPYSQCLQSLKLPHNQIMHDNKGMGIMMNPKISVFEGVARCRTLETLDVSGFGFLLSRLAEVIGANRILQKVEHDVVPIENWEGYQAFKNILARNRKEQTIVRSNWARVSTLMAFERANHNSALRHSVLPLLPEILKMIGYELSKP